MGCPAFSLVPGARQNFTPSGLVDVLSVGKVVSVEFLFYFEPATASPLSFRVAFANGNTLGGVVECEGSARVRSFKSIEAAFAVFSRVRSRSGLHASIFSFVVL